MEKILIVDDKKMNLDLAEAILKKEPYKLIFANNGQEAIDIIQKEIVSLIILDIMMPIMDGFEVLKYLKEKEEFKNIPIIVVSALSDKDAIMNAVNLGADEYLIKPFDIIDLKLRVKNLIKINRFNLLMQNQNSENTKASKSMEDCFSLIISKMLNFNSDEVITISKNLLDILKTLENYKNLNLKDFYIFFENRFSTKEYFKILKENLKIFFDIYLILK